MPIKKTIEELAAELYNNSIDNDIATLQDIYHQLRDIFAHTLFDLRNASHNHYSWLLIDQDAGVSLDKLKLAYDHYQNAKNDFRLWVNYKRELDDFRWIIAMAVSCQP